MPPTRNITDRVTMVYDEEYEKWIVLLDGDAMDGFDTKKEAIDYMQMLIQQDEISKYIRVKLIELITNICRKYNMPRETISQWVYDEAHDTQ